MISQGGIAAQAGRSPATLLAARGLAALLAARGLAALLAAGGLVTALAGCGPAAPVAAPAPSPGPPPRYEAMRWMPPTDDVVYAYRTENRTDGTTGVLMMRVRRVSDDQIDLVSPSRTEPLRYTDQGLMRNRTGMFLLRTPLTVGARWPSGLGANSRVGKLDVSLKTEAGAFDGCVEIIEERNAPVRGTITTTYCPEVGMVRVETHADEPPIDERLELRSFGKPVDIMSKDTTPAR